jgi:hypothetical protein
MSWNSSKLRSVHAPVRRPSVNLTYRPRLELLEDRWLLSTNVLSFHNDLLRTGANLTETTLTTSNVNSGTFGKLFSYPVDGQVYGQPLYMANVTLPDSTVHNIVFVVTEHDSAYAFDANGGGLLWQDSFIDPANHINPASSADLRCNSQISPEVGITDTPVIDPTTGTMYFVTETEDTSGATPVYHQQLHALNITDGSEVHPAVEIQAAVLGQGDAPFGSPNIVRFNPGEVKERAGVLLTNGIVYLSFASNCDITPTHGWLLGYDTQALQQVFVFNTSPNAQLNTIWGGGGAPGVDANGNIYFVTGNGAFSGGTFDPSLGDYGETVLKINSPAGVPNVADYFTPYNWDALDRRDRDLGSGQVMLLPDQPGQFQHLLVVAGKEGKIYLIDRDHMGQFHNGFDFIPQEVVGAIGGAGEYNVPTYFTTGAPNERWIYFAGGGDTLKAFRLSDQGRLTNNPTSQSSHVFPSPQHGANTSISANGGTNGIVWVIDPSPAGAVLFAYDATDVSNELYDTTMAGARDQLDGGVKFSSPTIADGQVFVGTAGSLTVFGLLPTGSGGRHPVLGPPVLSPGDLIGAPVRPGVNPPMPNQASAVAGAAGVTTVLAAALPDLASGTPMPASPGVADVPMAATSQAQSNAVPGADNPLSNDMDALVGAIPGASNLG